MNIFLPLHPRFIPSPGYAVRADSSPNPDIVAKTQCAADAWSRWQALLPGSALRNTVTDDEYGGPERSLAVRMIMNTSSRASPRRSTARGSLKKAISREARRAKLYTINVIQCVKFSRSR